MKGKVEVYKIMDDGSKELIVAEDNLIVDGAAESIVDFLTLPPDIAYEVEEVSPGNVVRTLKERVLDASNYIIQGFTTAKGLVGYKHNAHTYKPHNLITSAGTIGTVGGFKYEKPFLSVANEGVSPFDLSSDVLRITAFNSSKKSYIEFSGSPNQSPETDAAMDFDHLKTLYRAPLIFSVDIKLDYKNLPQKSVNEPGTGGAGNPPSPPVGRRITILSLTHHDNTFSGMIQWSDTLGEAFLLQLDSISQSAVMLKELGSGWYRAAVVAPSGLNEFEVANSTNGTNISCRIFPAGDNGEAYYGDGIEPSGGILISRPSLNVGSVPVNYFLGKEPILTRTLDEEVWPPLVSSVPAYNFDAANQNRIVGPYMLNYAGTQRFSVSSYDPSGSLPAIQNPILSGLEPGAFTDYESYIECDLNQDHNLNMEGFIGRPGNLSEYVLSSWSIGSDIQGFDMPTDARWLGCYNPGKIVKYFLVSGNTSVDYQEPVIDSQGGGEAAHINVQRTCDRNGYIRVKYDALGELDNLTTAAQRNPWLKCESTLAQAEEGYVEYQIQLAKYDVTHLNIYGGITNIGLYTLDYLEMLRNYHNYDEAVDKDVDTGDAMKFKLFSRKVFNENVTACSDNITEPSLFAAGLRAHQPLSITWGLQF